MEPKPADPWKNVSDALCQALRLYLAEDDSPCGCEGVYKCVRCEALEAVATYDRAKEIAEGKGARSS